MCIVKSKWIVSVGKVMHRIIQFTQLGKFGRFGNQIFQYIFARAYAEKYNATLEIPDWIGQKIFKDVKHNKLSKQLPRTEIDNLNFGDVNIDLMGYFQKKEHIAILEKDKIRVWLQFQDKWIEKFKDLSFDVVAHLRRGDYARKYSHVFCVISEKSYLDACNKFGISKENIVWLSEENQRKVDDLDDDIQFLPDFFSMVNADVLLRANSTFSFWAGFFNKNRVYSPVVKGKVGFQDVDFVEGNEASTVNCNDDFVFV